MPEASEIPLLHDEDAIPLNADDRPVPGLTPEEIEAEYDAAVAALAGRDVLADDDTFDPDEDDPGDTDDELDDGLNADFDPVDMDTSDEYEGDED